MMDLLVSKNDVLVRLPSQIKPLEAEDDERLGVLIEDAQDLVADAFEESGRDIHVEASIPRMRRAIQRVIREMVSAAVFIGPNVGVKRYTSTTGPQSDTVEMERAPEISFGGVSLTDDHRRALGLVASSDYAARGKFPRPHNLWGDNHDQW